jgi:hypothetical protein
MSTKSSQSIKIFNNSVDSRIKSESLRSLFFGLYRFDACKNQSQKISCKCRMMTSLCIGSQ